LIKYFFVRNEEDEAIKKDRKERQGEKKERIGVSMKDNNNNNNNIY